MRISDWRYIYVFLGISSVFFFQSCTEEPEAESFVNIENQYEVRLSQQLSPEGGVPALEILSLEPHECQNAFISHHTIFDEGKFLLFLNDIHTEGECVSGNQIIGEDILIGNSLNITPFEINLKNIVVNPGTLHIDHLDFETNFDSFDGLKVTRTQIHRIHPGMIWGSFSSKFEQTIEDVMEFIHDNQNTTELVSGDYGHFYVAPDKSVTIYNSPIEHESTFSTSSTISIFELENKLMEIKEIDESLVFMATNYDGSAINIH